MAPNLQSNDVLAELVELSTGDTTDPETILDLLKHLRKRTIDDPSTTMKALSKATRGIKRQKRSATGTCDDLWKQVIDETQKIIDSCKKMATEDDKKAAAKIIVTSEDPGLPKSVADYRARLVAGKKDLYKDPPVLPPTGIVVDKKCQPLPKRDKATGNLTFVASNEDTKKMLKDFHPNKTPEEILRAGAFGGTYFRPIHSAVTNISYDAQEVLKDTLDDAWIAGLPKKVLTSKTYHMGINKHGVKCGGSLGMWESSGWITEVDPYGWFQWFCRFYSGRRCSDDVRQISRWLKSVGPKGRFRSQLCGKIIVAATAYDDYSISPVIRQNLLQWGLEITNTMVVSHKKQKGL